jgi:hypothetical protein
MVTRACGRWALCRPHCCAGGFRRCGFTATTIAEIAENKIRTNCRMQGLVAFAGVGKRGPGSLACARVRDDGVGVAERNALPDACRVGTPSQARERRTSPPHAVRRWMQQRELLQTEELRDAARAGMTALERRRGTPSPTRAASVLPRKRGRDVRFLLTQ